MGADAEWPFPLDDVSSASPISTDIALYGGVFAKRHVIPAAGTYVPQHSHSYDHLSLLTAGVMRVWCGEDLIGDFTAPAEIRIPAHTKHTFCALEDGTTFYCIHNADRFEEDERHEFPTRPVPHVPVAEQAAELADHDSITIQEEPFADAWQDSAALRAEHEAEVGPREGMSLDPNVPLFEKLESIGMLHTMTVRSNGRIFGYLITIVGPSLENRKALVATQTAFFVSRAFRGAGIRLQRESIDALRAKGVHEVVVRAGVRGSGPKAGALYRRLGAEDFGQLFHLRLKDV